ncbi:major Facilitator Superfamily with SPX (SYG1/Pho81/XPR1) domain-containing protein [Actinidia rufa]|uniref:Major Facilitator Superfamily with SPX (SYG1/Pho81/XPR1) domain-containing protein n=1 Tax=Actinidia rufa TaxID=165716 RepID=A0A7J0FR74_9ERIC|nr:major Facilitator Superfamily with SPX (SYG1/Pho81/XPR1) domain-containing protein [Actinidia rufa]
MKKKVKQYAHQIEIGALEHGHVLKDFSKMLDNQIEKIVLFLLEQQGLLASRIAKLGELQEPLYEEPDISKMSELREAYRAVGQDLLQLLFFVEMNAIGLRKILKKIDKRFGYRFTDYYVKTRANHPYSQLQQVFKHVGLGAVVGSISRNLGDLQDRQGSYLSILFMTNLLFPYRAHLQDSVVDSIKAAVDRMGHSTNFLHFLAQRALIMQEELPTPTEEHADEDRYHFYVTSLEFTTVCGIVIGAMAVAQIFASVYFSAWSNKSYFKPLIWVLPELLIAVISVTVYRSKLACRLQPGFVSASALGMACGPALAGLLQTNFKIYKLTFNQDTLPGWVMSIAWLIYLLWLWIAFKEPLHETEEKHGPEGVNADQKQSDVLEKGLVQPLLLGSQDNQQAEDADQECDGSEEAPEKSRLPATSVASVYRLLTPSVNVQLLIYFMLKYAMEILLAESSVITTYYFCWSTSSVAIFLAYLGLTVLPVNIVVGTYIATCLKTGILLSFHIIIPYSVPQYVCSGLIMFVFAEVLEGVNLSLLSRVMSSRLSRGTYNGGLLSTEAGTIARVIADATITVAGYLGDASQCETVIFLLFKNIAARIGGLPPYIKVEVKRIGWVFGGEHYLLEFYFTNIASLMQKKVEAPPAAHSPPRSPRMPLCSSWSAVAPPTAIPTSPSSPPSAAPSPTSPPPPPPSASSPRTASAAPVPRVLGGGTALNAGFYTRAAADYMADAGWGVPEAEEAYRWVEGVVAFEPAVGSGRRR